MKNTGYQQAVIAKKISRPGELPLDADGNLCVESGKKQAILLLEGEQNPFPDEYEVVGFFNYGDIIDGFDTRVYNPEACPVSEPETSFEVDRSTLSYPVSRDGMGFDITDIVYVSSSMDYSYLDYDILSAPDWLTATKGSTVGTVNTLNLVVSRNRDSDAPKTGNIVLKQNDTDDTLTIKVSQKGRLTDGVPTEYPYVNEETVADGNYKVVQIGEQIVSEEVSSYLGNTITGAVTRIDRRRGADIGSSRIEAWAANYNGVNGSSKLFDQLPTPDEYHSIFGLQYNKVGLAEFVDGLKNLYGEVSDEDRDVYKHHVPLDADIEEMFGFLVANNWDGTGNPWDANGSVLTSVMKGSLDTSADGYDDVRITYPATWNAPASDIIKGSDRYALGFGPSAEYQLYEIDDIQSNLARLFRVEFFNKEEQPDNTDYIDIPEYKKHWNGYGWIYHKGYQVGAFGHSTRTFRYRQLGYNIYTDGSEIRKINNGESVPSGFAEVPRGALRGAWFGNSSLSYDKLSLVQDHVLYAINNGNGGIG